MADEAVKLTPNEAVRVWERSRKYAAMSDNCLEEKTLEMMDKVIDDLQKRNENFGATTDEDGERWDGMS